MPRKDENDGKNENGEKRQEKLFVPVPTDNGAEAVKLQKQIVENDNTKNVIDSLRDEMEKSREHELKLFQMMCHTFTNHQHQQYSHQTMVSNATPSSSSFTQDNMQPSTSFINQWFQSNLHVMQPVFQQSASQPFSASLPLSGHFPYDHNKGKHAGY